METDGPRTKLDDAGVAELVLRVVEQGALAAGRGRRFVLGIAGVAGSGKSTLAERLVRELDAASGVEALAAFVPMDGFHWPNAELRRRGWLSRKGAPLTYDALGYRAMLDRYGDGSEVGAVPRYCREVHEPVWDGPEVTSATRVLVAEGQYLLLTDEPWSGLAEVLDETWWLDTPASMSERWTVGRHVAVGRTPEQAAAKYRENDGPNSVLVRERRRRADRVVFW